MFLSTDAGGVGLNLQAASAVVNFEPPWNPARLEQRIGRVHRLGQSRPVHVIHMLTTGSIEERVWETLRLKKSLFEGVFDSPAAEVSFAKLGRKTVLQAVKEIFADQPARPKPVVGQAPAEAVPLKSIAAAAPLSPPSGEASEASVPGADQAACGAGVPVDGIAMAAAGLMEAGVKFIESLAGGASNLASDSTQSGFAATERPARLRRARRAAGRRGEGAKNRREARRVPG